MSLNSNIFVKALKVLEFSYRALKVLEIAFLQFKILNCPWQHLRGFLPVILIISLGHEISSSRALNTCQDSEKLLLLLEGLKKQCQEAPECTIFNVKLKKFRRGGGNAPGPP